jgi:histidinol-phosphate/aromatic aminotransferase/cobyric acid decarboxylase-like protein
MKKKLLMNRNEVPYMPSPKVIQSFRNFDLKNISRYFEGYYGSSLIPKLSGIFDLPEKQISVGYGIEFFLRSIFERLDPKNDTILTHEICFSYYTQYAKSKKLRLAKFALTEHDRGFAFDVGDGLKKINRK